MDYKKIIRSRKLRGEILRLLRFIPDEPMLRLQYRIKMDAKLDLKNPQKYSEKIQWYKLFWKDPVMATCVDKYEVRSYIESKGCAGLLPKLYGIYDRAEDVDFDSLPSSFVIKDTLGGGGTAVILVPDKELINREAVIKQMRQWVETPIVRDYGREWPYYSGKNHRVLIEEFLAADNSQGCGLTDYKFLCFDGRAEYVQLMTERIMGEACFVEGILTRNFKLLSVCGKEHRLMQIEEAVKPENYMEMLDIADYLSNGFPHARIDLYNVNGRIYFGEITFFPASGYKLYSDDSFDYELGRKFNLPEIKQYHGNHT